MGMMQASNPTLSHGNFNGIVEAEGQKVEVRNGVADVEGQQFMVSDDGKMVINTQGQLVGHIENGKFVVVTPEYHDKMLKAGYLQ